MDNSGVLRLDPFWRTRYDRLRSRGYILCPQNCPGCQKVSDACTADKLPGYTDSLPEPHTLDRLIAVPRTTRATRAHDGQLVVVQVVGEQVSGVIEKLHTLEFDLQHYNRCIPILDMFQDPDSESGATAGQRPNRDQKWIVVIPFLRSVPSSDLRHIRDVVNLVNQVLLGIRFMHSCNVGHRDCSLHNIVTSSGVSRLHKLHREELVERSMLPHGPATAYYYSLPSTSLQVGLHEPTDDADATSQPQYYLTGMDYWIFMTRATARSGGFWTSGYCSRDRSPPEYDETQFRSAYPVLTNWEHRQTYNPFWLDVFLIGTMLRKDFVEKFSNVDFLNLLILNITNHLPEDRLSSEECVKEWITVLSTMASCRFSRSLRPRDTRMRRFILKLSNLAITNMFSDTWKRIRGKERDMPQRKAYLPISGRGLF